mgnify:CR=1 FL=1
MHKSPGFQGAINEMLVAHDLMKHGWYVFRALSAVSPYDLMASRDNIDIRVEVRAGSRVGKYQAVGVANNGALNKQHYDLLAIVLPTEEIIYRENTTRRGGLTVIGEYLAKVV